MSVIVRIDEARLPEISEMPRDLRLFYAQNLDQIIDAHFILAEQNEYSQSRPVGERAEHHLRMFPCSDAYHIRLGDYDTFELVVNIVKAP